MQKPINNAAGSASSNSLRCAIGGCTPFANGVVINEVTIKFNPVLELPYEPRLKERAKALRQAENLPEVLFWMQVHKRKFHHLDFDRQRIIVNYMVDFYIKKLGLVIEIDGNSHDDKVNYDRVREDYLISLGLKIYRISVNDILRHMGFAIMGLEDYIVKEYGESGS